VAAVVDVEQSHLVAVVVSVGTVLCWLSVFFLGVGVFRNKPIRKKTVCVLLIFDGCLKFYDNKPNMKETD
jgi:hypothetical protein